MRITSKSRRKDPTTIEDRRGDAPGTVYMSDPPKTASPESRTAKAHRRRQEISIDKLVKGWQTSPPKAKASTKGTPSENKARASKARADTASKSKKMGKKVARREKWQERGFSFPVSMSKLGQGGSRE